MEQLINTLWGEVNTNDPSIWRLAEHYFTPIKALYLDPTVTEILVNRFDDISIEQDGKLVRTACTFGNETELRTFIEQIGTCLTQPINDDESIMDARLPDCSRLCCTLPASTPDGSTMTLRVVPQTHLTADKLVTLGAMSQPMLDFLIEHVRQGSNILISGNTGSGKTSLLRALTRYFNIDERVITCEDTQELFLSWLHHKVSLEAPKRKHNKIVMKNLIEAALRMRPDRILVGEIRHAAAADAFLQAINTGHSGCITTIHANGCRDAVSRLQYLIASAGLITFELAEKQIVGSVDVLIQASRHPEFGRKVTEICVIEDGKIQTVFAYNPKTGEHEMSPSVAPSIQ